MDDRKTLPEIREEVLKVSHNEVNVDMFWKLVSFPIHPEFYRYTDEEQKKLEKLTSELRHQHLKFATPEYPDDIKVLASESPSPLRGKNLDVVSLLSSFGGRDLIRNNGDRVTLDHETFKGKYVMVCCFHVPDVSGRRTIQLVVNLCNELYATRDDFEMVMVARMNTLADECEVFDYFFSGFPESCLAVPFEDKHRRDYICKVLDLGIDIKNGYNCLRFLFLNPEGRVLPRLDMYSNKLHYYGAETFPFKNKNIYQSKMECHELVFGDASLERILRCNDFSPDFVYKTNPREEVAISQLGKEFKNKHVGLYLCTGGDFLSHLLDMYEQCKEKELEFEIVVVYLPFKEPIDPKRFQEKIDSLLHKHNVYGWWCLPFNNSVSRRFGEGYCTEWDDKVIVVGPDVEHLDMYGDCVIRNHGVDAFPFTVEAAKQLRMKQLREMTLESLFAYDDDDDVLFFRGIDRNDVISLKDFQGSKNFLFIDELFVADEDGDGYRCVAYGERFESIYNEMKAMDGCNFEVVFVEIGRDDLVVAGEERDEILSKMPWYVCSKNGTNSTKLKELVRLFGEWRWQGVLVGFGVDGRVCSVQFIQDFFSEQSQIPQEEFSLSDTLYHDVVQILEFRGFGDIHMQKFAIPDSDERDYEEHSNVDDED